MLNIRWVIVGITVLSSLGVRGQEASLKLLPDSLNPPLRICYISLNNENEYTVMKAFVGGLFRTLKKPETISVEEFQAAGTNPEQAIQKMAESGQPCDGVVISGHHTGAFGGSRAWGSLSVDFLAKASCLPKTQKFFEGIHSLWLQGCRTLGARDTEIEGVNNVAEFHGQRVNQVRDEDSLEENRFELENEFSSVLDNESPYSVRFLKAFPNSRLFGWTRTAPGVQAQSERSLPYQIANLARRNQLGLGRSVRNLQNPMQQNLNPESAQAYLTALEQLLRPAAHPLAVSDDLESWFEQGLPEDASRKNWGFSNRDLNAYPAMNSSNDEQMLTSRRLDCRLVASESNAEKIQAMKDILSSRKTLGLSYYNLRSTFDESRRDSGQREQIRQLLGDSKHLRDYVQVKLEAPNVSLTRKIEFLQLARITGMAVAEDKRANITAKVREGLLAIIPKTGTARVEARDAQITLLRSVTRESFFTAEDWRQILSDVQTTNPGGADELLENLFGALSNEADAEEEMNVEKFIDELSRMNFTPKFVDLLLPKISRMTLSLDYVDGWMERGWNSMRDRPDDKTWEIRDALISYLRYSQFAESWPTAFFSSRVDAYEADPVRQSVSDQLNLLKIINKHKQMDLALRLSHLLRRDQIHLSQNDVQLLASFSNDLSRTELDNFCPDFRQILAQAINPLPLHVLHVKARCGDPAAKAALLKLDPRKNEYDTKEFVEVAVKDLQAGRPWLSAAEIMSFWRSTEDKYGYVSGANQPEFASFLPEFKAGLEKIDPRYRTLAEFNYFMRASLPERDLKEITSRFENDGTEMGILLKDFFYGAKPEAAKDLPALIEKQLTEIRDNGSQRSSLMRVIDRIEDTNQRLGFKTQALSGLRLINQDLSNYFAVGTENFSNEWLLNRPDRFEESLRLVLQLQPGGYRQRVALENFVTENRGLSPAKKTELKSLIKTTWP